MDSACLFWERACGQLGACRVYDPSKFRKVFHGVTAIIMFVAFIVDAVVWVKAPSIRFVDEDDEQPQRDETSASNGADIAASASATTALTLASPKHQVVHENHDGESAV